LRRAATLGALALALAAGCAHAPPPSERSRAQQRSERAGPRGARAEVGIASFYANKFHGRRTASGARYDKRALTCAHRKAPFGSRLRVTDIESGRSVVVTVNDRGPFTRGRVVDLSLAAARKLRIVARGVARVRVEPIRE
jgi:rare lipoprotein A